MMRLSRAVTFKFRLAQVLPPNDAMTVPVLRLMMAVDDVRRAQIHLLEAHEKLDVLPAAEKYLALGEWLYSMRLLFSHVHEAGIALRSLDSKAKKRVDAAVSAEKEGAESLKALRTFFNDANYDKSLTARVRNSIGSHYDDREVSDLVQAEVGDESVLEATAATVGGLSRMADPLVRAIMNTLNGGDFMTDEKHTLQTAHALDIAGHLTTFVDYLFNALMQHCPDAVIERREAIIDVPPLVIRAREAVDEARRQIAKTERTDW